MANVRTISKPGSVKAKPNTTLNKASKYALQHMRGLDIDTRVLFLNTAILAYTAIQ